MVDCCNAAGGRVVISANGQQWSARSSVTVTPTNYERTSGANQDGSLYTTYKPMPAEADIVLSDRCGLSINDIMGCPIDVTIDLIDVRRRYLFTKGVVIGRPQINTETGEIRNIKITSNDVTEQNY